VPEQKLIEPPQTDVIEVTAEVISKKRIFKLGLILFCVTFVLAFLFAAIIHG
jgi:hypothetical protein